MSRIDLRLFEPNSQLLASVASINAETNTVNMSKEDSLAILRDEGTRQQDLTQVSRKSIWLH